MWVNYIWISVSPDSAVFSIANLLGLTEDYLMGNGVFVIGFIISVKGVIAFFKFERIGEGYIEASFLAIDVAIAELFEVVFFVGSENGDTLNNELVSKEVSVCTNERTFSSLQIPIIESRGLPMEFFFNCVI